MIGLVRTKGRPFSIKKMLARACTFRLRCFTDINNVHFKNFKFTQTCSSPVCYVFPWSLPCDSKHVSQRSLPLALRAQTTASIRKTTTTQDTYPPGLLRRSIVSHSEIALLLSVWNGVERGTKRIRKKRRKHYSVTVEIGDKISKQLNAFARQLNICTWLLGHTTCDRRIIFRCSFS